MKLNLSRFQSGGSVLDEVIVDGRDPKTISKEFLNNWISNPEFVKRLQNNLEQRESNQKDNKYKGFIDKYINRNSSLKDAQKLQKQSLDNLNSTKMFLGYKEDEAFEQLTEEDLYTTLSRWNNTRGVYDPKHHAVWVEEGDRNFQSGILTHELTHATKMDKELMGIVPAIKTKLKHMDNTKEVYPRIMQIRFESGIKPGEYIDSERMDLIYQDMKQNEDLFKVYSKEQIRNLLNNLATSDDDGVKLIAKNGGEMKNKIEIPKEIFENFYFKEGGTKENRLVDTLAGGVQYGMDKDAPIAEPNVEVEKGEWILDSNGLRVVIGDKHKDGGEDMLLEDGAKILSNYLEAPKSLINKINKEYDTKIKAKATYSDVLNQTYKKLGLNKLQDEQKTLIEKVKFQQENTKDENTQMANIQILSDKIKEIEDKKQPLEVQAEEVFSILFDKQEASKPKDKVEEDVMYAQDGGTVPNWQILNPYALPEYGYQNFQPSGVAGVAVDKTLATPKTMEIFPTISQKHFQNGAIRPQDNLSFQTDIASYYTDALKSAEKLYGKDSDKFKEISTFVNNNNFVNDPENVRYTDNKYGDFTSTRPNIAFELLPQEEYDRVKKDGVNTIGQLKVKYPELYNQYITDELEAPDDVWLAPTDNTLDEVVIEVDGKIENENKQRQSAQDRTGVFNAPDQTPRVPNPMEAHLKTNRRYERMDYTAISPEAQLQEIARNQVRSEQNLDLLPSSVKAGVLANMGANVSEIANKAISQVQQINNQSFQNVQNTNRQIQMQEENASAQDALNFEQRQLLAKARTDNDYSNWWNTIQRNQALNFDTINKLNLSNTLYSDFQFTDRGIESSGNPTDVLSRLRANPQMQLTPEQMVASLEQQYGKEYVKQLTKTANKK